MWSKYLNNIHKIVSPQTYSCNLCNLTHDSFSEKKEWRDFRKNVPLDFLFMYKNEFFKSYPADKFKNLKFPVVFEKYTKNLTVVLDAEKLASIQTTKQLIGFLQKKN